MKKNKNHIIIPFGGDIPQIGFSQKEWDKSYGVNAHPSVRVAEQKSRDRTNAERIKNGLRLL